jgi:diaminohydroxyphosphoribosylaminopyrimidine deaminase / 5-amino-6-(5-phosphoribosylamino)uracil reductase
LEQFMHRALALATLGRGRVSPNPLVGCVIVHEPPGAVPRILGEGWHRVYGQAHAERNALAAVSPADRALLPQATVYVTLEPCAHQGKQPPCADLLIENRVGRVVVCTDDPFPEVAGRGIARLRAAGIPVEVGLLAREGRAMNARFFTAIEQNRPYLILKWAESLDGFIGGVGAQPVPISGPLSRRLVHRWRSEEDAILVGTTTARLDNPRLDTRLWSGPELPGLPVDSSGQPGVSGRNPVRITIDRNGTLPPGLNLFDTSQPTLVYTATPARSAGLTEWISLDFTAPTLPQLLADWQHRRIQSVFIEGGAVLLNSFLEANLWDELRVFRAPILLGAGVKAPAVRGRLAGRERVGTDELLTFRP